MPLLQNITVTRRLGGLVLLATLSILGLALSLSFSERSLLIQERQNAVRQNVEIAHGLLQQFQAQAAQGVITNEEAQKRGVNSLEAMTYKHFQKEMNLINKAYYEVMTEGDKTGQPFTFPIPTVNITEDFDWDGENTELLFENTAKIGSSYFQNFIGSQYVRDADGKLVENPKAYKPGHVRSMCCRLQLDLRELLKRGGGLFGSAEMTGSIGFL